MWLLALGAVGLVLHATVSLSSRGPAGPGQAARIQAARPEPVLRIVSAGAEFSRPDAQPSQPPAQAEEPLEKLFRAMRVVESVNSPSAVGDGGRSRGPYQISRLYWKDATGFGGVRWGYIEGVWHERECRQVMLWYWQRYAPAALAEARRSGALRAMEVLARTHNGGPAGPDKPSTLRYWQRVRSRLGQKAKASR